VLFGKRTMSLTGTLSIHGSTAHVNLERFFSFLTHTESVGRLGWEISPSQGRYIHTEHKHRINAHIHASSGIRTHDPNFREGEDGSCHWDVKDKEIYVGCTKLTFRKSLHFDYTSCILNLERDFMSN
jgi:hypothetical protein